MTEVAFHALESIADERLQYVVTAARFRGKWVFVQHKQRQTWELPGGRREPGETVAQAMERELWEETGALEAATEPVCIYSVTKDALTTYGVLYFSEIIRMGQLPENFEIEKVQLTDSMPKAQTYPEIQPALFSYIQGWLNKRSNPGELWDVYDENRNKTGELHRRGEPLGEGQYHLVVHVWILGSDGRFLITKRSPNKGFPNMWESTGGSALAGDDSLTAALREVREETGIALEEASGERILSGKRMDFFRDVWLFRQDVDPESVILQPGETVDKRLASAEEIRELRKRDLFVPYDYLEELFAGIGIDNPL